jgi:hypothetical protein
MVMVPTGLLDLGKRLLGRREIAGLEGLTQGCEGILAGGLAAGGGCALGRVLLEGAEGLLGRREIAGLEGLAQCLELALHRALTLAGWLVGVGGAG